MGVIVKVGVMVGVFVGVGVAVGVEVGVAVPVGVRVAVAVLVLVGVKVGVGVGVGVEWPTTPTTFTGDNLLVVVPSPSAQFSLKPQHLTTPAVVSAQV